MKSFFRNLTLYRFSKSAASSIDDTEFPKLLEDKALKPCGPMETQSQGWVSPWGRQEQTLLHAQGGFFLLSLGIERKLLPPAVVHEALAQKVERLQGQREGKAVRAAERKRLKEEVLFDLLPKAFVTPLRLGGYLDRRSGWLLIDTAAKKPAEGFLTVLRETLGSFPALPLDPEVSPKSLLTNWVMGDKLPAGFALGNECELKDPTDQRSVVRCRGQDLESDEVRQHVKKGKQVTQLGLVIDDQISLVLGEDLTVRKLQFLDAATQELQQAEQATPKEELDAVFAIMSLSLKTVLERFEAVFGLERPSARARAV